MDENCTTVTIGGRDYTLVLDLKVMMHVEQRFSTPQKYVTCVEILSLIERGSTSHLLGLVCAMLSRHHPKLSTDDVIALAQQYGGIFKFVTPIMGLAQNLIADPKDVEELGIAASGNPPTAQTPPPTGADSTSAPVAQG